MRWEWILRHYNLAGGPINAADYSGNVSNQIKHAEDRQVHFVLDNYEDLQFSLYLDDPMSYVVKPLTSVVKLWRKIYNDSNALIYADPDNTPAFSGYVGYVGKDGASGSMKIKVYSPLWRLKMRFHVNNHYLKTNINTGLPYTESELIWKFIDLLQNAFPTNQRSYMGMAQGNFMWANDPTMGPYFQAKGENGWTNIFERILSRAESPELIPRYFHANGNPLQMYLDTNKARGIDRTASVSFNYHTGINDNLDNLTEEIEIQDGEFANYIWVAGQGGPNSGKLALALNVADDEFGYDTIKVYQHLIVAEDLQLFNSTMADMANGELARIRRYPTNYSVEVSPATTDEFAPQAPYYGMDYTVGDAVTLRANKNSLVVNTQQRIYECTLTMSDNNVELVHPVVGDDVKEHILTN